MANSPTSFRFPFESQIAALPPEVQQVHRNVWNAVVDIQNAVKILHTNSTANTSTIKTITQTVNNTASSSTGVSSFNSMTGAVNYFPFLGNVNDQTGATAYTTQASDNGILILVNDASPIAVTLNSAISNPYFFFVENQGAGTATLTPSTGLVNGVASFSLLSGYFTITFFDGNNWLAMNLPIVPVNTPSVLHQFFTSYNAITGVFSQAQPDFTDISGIASPSQLPTPTTTTLGGVEAISPVTHQWVNQIDTSGVPHLSQPAFTDVSGQITTSQLPAGQFSGTITTAKLTVGGTNGSMTFLNGSLSSQVAAT